MIVLKRVLPLLMSVIVLAGCGAKEPVKVDEAPKQAVRAEHKNTVTGVVRKDGSWLVLSTGGRNYVLVPGRCDSEDARKTIESNLGRALTVSGHVDGSKLRVDKIAPNTSK
ncbi:MAG: hypothetical protein AB1441_10200 [Bacillota bacterium]